MSTFQKFTNLYRGLKDCRKLKKVVIVLFSRMLYFCYMESILIHPESADQLKTVKAVLKALKVPFEPQSGNLPPHVSQSVEKSIKQFDAGHTISLSEFKEKHFSKK